MSPDDPVAAARDELAAARRTLGVAIAGYALAEARVALARGEQSASALAATAPNRLSSRALLRVWSADDPDTGGEFQFEDLLV